MSNRTKGNLALLLTAAMWGSGFISQKLGNEVMPPMTFNAVRQLLAAMLLTPFVIRSLKKSGYLSRAVNSASQIEHRKKKLLMACLVCGAFLLIGTEAQQIGLLTVSAGKSGFISALYIVMVPFFSVLLGEKVRKKSVVCVIAAMAGFAVMSLHGGLSGATPGDWWTLVSAAAFAAQIVMVNEYVDKDNALAISCLQFWFCGIVGMVIALIMEGWQLPGVFAVIPILIYQTLGPTATGYTMQTIGQKYTDSSTAALIMSLEAVLAAVFGAVFLGEMMSAREMAGAAIILAATVIGQRE